jgi:hypothetical protein
VKPSVSLGKKKKKKRIWASWQLFPVPLYFTFFTDIELIHMHSSLFNIIPASIQLAGSEFNFRIEISHI